MEAVTSSTNTFAEIKTLVHRSSSNTTHHMKMLRYSLSVTPMPPYTDKLQNYFKLSPKTNCIFSRITALSDFNLNTQTSHLVSGKADKFEQFHYSLWQLRDQLDNT